MADRATPNIPARDFDETARFYEALGFSQTWRDPAWMILVRGALQLEFFPHPDLDPSASWFGACLRLSEPARFYEACLAAGVPEGRAGIPRLVPRAEGDAGPLFGALIDPNGSLLRLIKDDQPES